MHAVASTIALSQHPRDRCLRLGSKRADIVMELHEQLWQSLGVVSGAFTALGAIPITKYDVRIRVAGIKVLGAIPAEGKPDLSREPIGTRAGRDAFWEATDGDLLGPCRIGLVSPRTGCPVRAKGKDVVTDHDNTT